MTNPESGCGIQNVSADKVSRVSEIASDFSLASEHADVHTHIPLSLRIGFWTCVVIAVAAVVRRVLALLRPSHSVPAQVMRLDGWFASHTTLTLAHIIPALLFVLITPFLVSSDYLALSLVSARCSSARLSQACGNCTPVVTCLNDRTIIVPGRHRFCF
jgi:hypothetical protein